MCSKFHRVIQESVETDPELTAQQRNKLQFIPEDNAPLNRQTSQPPVRIRKVVDILKGYAETIKQKVENDPVIKMETEKIIAEAFRPESSDETDSGATNEGIFFGLKIVCSHIQEVFRLLIDDSLKPGGEFLFFTVFNL